MPSDRPTIVTREAWRVRFVECGDFPAEIPVSWEQLERAVGSLRGRTFVGAFDPRAGWYRACVRVPDDAEVTGAETTSAEAALPLATIPGGRFLRLRLSGDPAELYPRLPAAFDALHDAAAADPTRPDLELYRRHDLVDALMPIRS